MAVRVIVPTPLRQYAGKQDSVEIEAKTVAEALAGLTAQYGELRRHLFTDDGKIRSFVNIYLNDEDIRYLQKDQTPVRANDVISIVPSIAGGAATLESYRGGYHPALQCICT
jgi:molybdopterin converting factor small subunit